MENFSQLDIFDTKGTEYLFVIGYLLILILFWRISGKQVKLKSQVQQALNHLTAQILRIPQGLYFNKNHTWAYLEKSGLAKVGVDDFFQHATGPVHISRLKNQGDSIRKGETLAEIVQNGKTLRIFSPLSGKITGTNPALYEDPEVINQDPYDKGWIYQLRPANWKAETNSCLLAEDATQWAAQEMNRLKDFLTGRPVNEYQPESSLIMLQDGGELRDHILSELPEEIWNDFQKEFLDTRDKD